MAAQVPAKQELKGQGGFWGFIVGKLQSQLVWQFDKIMVGAMRGMLDNTSSSMESAARYMLGTSAGTAVGGNAPPVPDGGAGAAFSALGSALGSGLKGVVRKPLQVRTPTPRAGAELVRELGRQWCFGRQSLRAAHARGG